MVGHQGLVGKPDVCATCLKSCARSAFVFLYTVSFDNAFTVFNTSTPCTTVLMCTHSVGLSLIFVRSVLFFFFQKGYGRQGAFIISCDLFQTIVRVGQLS